MPLTGHKISFPDYEDSKAKAKIADLVRLMDADLTATQYINAMAAARLIATLVRSYQLSLNDDKWFEDAYLARCVNENRRFNLVCAAVFDIVANMEYLHGRIVDSKWIYCNRADSISPNAYYSFLKQCPRCCLDKGLESRLSGAQHKPSSHHIGEITTTICVLILKLLAEALDEPLTVATVQKQSHDVDAFAYRHGILVLFEIKASPLVTFPVVCDLNGPLYKAAADGERAEYKQHSLVDVMTSNHPMSLYIPHRDSRIPLGIVTNQDWPYSPATDFFADPDNFLEFLSAWLELYYAYSIPKTQRLGDIQKKTYLVNGWGDEIDSNKTKPGLGRTDDLKKGTYQVLKFGAYYRDNNSKLQVRSALVANIDPVFLRAEYLDGLKNVRWGHDEAFFRGKRRYWIKTDDLRWLYEGILAFNDPMIHDELVKSLFDFEKADAALQSGQLNPLLSNWQEEV